MIFEASVAVDPLTPSGVDPAQHLHQTLDLQHRRSGCRDLPTRDQPRLLQHLQMPRHRLLSQVERRRQRLDRGIAVRQLRNDRHPGGIGQRGEHTRQFCIMGKHNSSIAQ